MARLDRTNAPHYVYRCFDKDGRLIYVGSSGDLFGRLATHRRTSWWAPQVVKVKAEYYPTGVAARIVERRIIRDDMPRWNKSGKWATHSRWTQADWIDWLTVLIQHAKYPTQELYARLRDYRTLYHCEAPAWILAQLAEMEEARVRLRAEMAEKAEVQRKRMAEVQRLDEIALARDRKAGLA